MRSNIYEDSVKYLFNNASDHIATQSFHLGKRITIVMIVSFLYIILVNTLTPLLIKKMWNKRKDWIENIDVNRLPCRYKEIFYLNPLKNRSGMK